MLCLISMLHRYLRRCYSIHYKLETWVYLHTPILLLFHQTFCSANHGCIIFLYVIVHDNGFFCSSQRLLSRSLSWIGKCKSIDQLQPIRRRRGFRTCFSVSNSQISPLLFLSTTIEIFLRSHIALALIYF